MLRRWLDGALDAKWHGARVKEIIKLKGDASNRRFWRVTIEREPLTRRLWHASTGRRPSSQPPATAVVVDLGPDDLPAYVRTLHLLSDPPAEPPFLNVQRFLKRAGVDVPDVYVAAPEYRMLLVEDVGDTPLFQAALGADEPADLYRQAIDQLLILHVTGTRRLDHECIASSIAYDRRLFRFELDQFLEFGVQSLPGRACRASLVCELDDLADRLGQLPRVLSHRDYHGHNLFLHDGRLRVIDFQDALLAPAAQDLAVLLTTRDTDRVIDPAAEDRLLNYYLAGLARRDTPCPEPRRFLESYRLCVLQHALKVIGRFNFLERGGKTGYAIYVPHAIAQACRMLAAGDDFPRLRQAFNVACDAAAGR